MKTKINKQKEVEKYLERGWNVTNRLSIHRWDLYRLAPAIARIKKKRPDLDIDCEIMLSGTAQYGRYFSRAKQKAA